MPLSPTVFLIVETRKMPSNTNLYTGQEYI